MELNIKPAEERTKTMSRKVTAYLVAAITPVRRATVAVVAGVVLVLWGLALWSIPVAMITAGVLLVVYGAVLIDLDASPVSRRHKKKVIE